jgi:hypothetical protein
MPRAQNDLAQEMIGDPRHHPLIDRLVDEVRRLRANVGITQEALRGTNAAAASIMVIHEDRVVRHIVARMNSTVEHSEMYIARRARELRNQNRGAIVYVEAVFTERSACGDCVSILRRANQVGGESWNTAILYIGWYNPRDAVANARRLLEGWGLL